MDLVATAIADVKVIIPDVFADDRGYFKETWNARTFSKLGLDATFVQDNQSRSVRGTLRGLHYQIGQAQGKLVRVLAGEVFDVAVDLRRSSATFGSWVGVTLSSDNHKMIWIPEGFAHGFYVTSESADLFYKCTEFYSPAHERCVLWNDPALAINWPVAEAGQPIVSGKDAKGVPFARAEYFP